MNNKALLMAYNITEDFRYGGLKIKYNTIKKLPSTSYNDRLNGYRKGAIIEEDSNLQPVSYQTLKSALSTSLNINAFSIKLSQF